MKRDELNGLIDEELGRIDRGAKGSPQRMFRAPYRDWRAHDLSEDPKADPMGAIFQATETMQTTHPGFSPTYDEEWFRSRGHS
jgi:hypothetical protein